MTQTTAITVGDIQILVDYENNYVALSNTMTKKLIVLSLDKFNENFGKLITDNGTDFPIRGEG